MNHKHRKVLHSIFAHPVSANIDFREVESVFRELGATLSHTGTGRLSVHLGNHTGSFHAAHHTVAKEDVAHMRKFLESCGIDPSRDYPI